MVFVAVHPQIFQGNARVHREQSITLVQVIAHTFDTQNLKRLEE